MTENEFMLQDRIAKIKSVNEQHDLLNNAYISFSGGKDSTVLSYLMDEALPENKIPRLFLIMLPQEPQILPRHLPVRLW